jgi:hypothetical protein
MTYLDVSLSGWNKMSICFRVLSKQRIDDIEVFKCVDMHGNEFYIEDSSIFAKYSKNTNSYNAILDESLGDIIHKMQNTNSIYEVIFNTVEGKERVLKGYTIEADKIFGYTLVYDLDKKGPRRVNNRDIISLILNNTKYIVK